MKLFVVADKNTWAGDEFAVESAASCDAIISLGDLRVKDLEDFRDLRIPKLGVYGNHCIPDYLEELGFINMHLRRGSFKKHALSVVGIEGCLQYKKTSVGPQYTQDEMCEMLADLPPADIVISHSPPKGIHDTAHPPHVGFEALADYCNRHEPRLVIHGHTYPKETLSRSRNTVIAYVGGWDVIDTEQIV